MEVEQRDETDNESDDVSMGSNSNPSEDNLDEEDVYKNVYGLNNAKEFMESRKIKEAEFIEKLEMDN